MRHVGQCVLLERATAVQWNFSGDTLVILRYAVGDTTTFEAAIKEISGLDATAATVETRLSKLIPYPVLATL